MKLIFRHGERLFNKEEMKKECYKAYTELLGLNLLHYPKVIDAMSNNNAEFPHSIYGDDFKIGIVPRNVRNNCCLIIRDYDENQKLETETCIDFSKEELSKLINLLEIVKNEM